MRFVRGFPAGWALSLLLFAPQLASAAWDNVFTSAVVAGMLWETSKYVFAWSLQYFHYDQIYGSVGAVVAVLTWSYVSSLILMFGAQLSVVLHQEHTVAEMAAEAPASPS